MKTFFRQIRNHVITGFIFIMPVLIVLAVISKFWKDLLKLGARVSKVLQVDTVLGPSGDAVMAVIFFLIICVVAGFLIKISFLKQFSEKVDQQLEIYIPGYTQIRSQTRKKIGVDKAEETVYETCLIKVIDLWQPGYIVDKNPDGSHTVFVPQAPVFSNGQVYVVGEDRIRRLAITSDILNQYLKNMGKGIMKIGL
jgi:uncharacterized membrane protein